MSSSDVFLKAFLRRLSIRLESGLAEVASSIDSLIKEGPSHLRRELQDFYEEVISETDRVKEEESSKDYIEDLELMNNASADDPQKILERLRLKVSDMSQKLESKY